ncbi:hypothetical protein ACIP5N_04195 [Streptomyces sp. NPDC088768]|uniref:hypothetical protein n=1 Tax=Streptomyces sp. NPDC088768 TaxID=3365894 RepID=UPI0038271F43
MRTDLGGSDIAAEEHWGSAITWLTLASGVMDLKIDLTVNQRANYMCSAAWPYEDAQNATASKVHLELTRLLYAYCAVESMTRAMDPTYGDDGKLVKHAKPIVSRYTGALPPHFLCIVDHLYDHCRDDPRLNRHNRLEESFQIPKGKISLPLQVGTQLRHLLAHGIFHLPPPDADSKGWKVGGANMTCTAQKGTASLLMAAQTMLHVAYSEGNLGYDEEEIELDDPVPTSGDEESWVSFVTPAEYLAASHLHLYGEL